MHQSVGGNPEYFLYNNKVWQTDSSIIFHNNSCNNNNRKEVRNKGKMKRMLKSFSCQLKSLSPLKFICYFILKSARFPFHRQRMVLLKIETVLAMYHCTKSRSLVSELIEGFRNLIFFSQQQLHSKILKTWKDTSRPAYDGRNRGCCCF